MNLAPPSKPDRPVSGIRLSGCWSERNGLTQTWQTLDCAIRAMPLARHSRFRGPSESNPVSGSLRGSSTHSLLGTMLDCSVAFRRHRSHQLPMSLGSTIITRFFATMDTLTPAGAREPRVSVPGRSPWLLNMHFWTFRLQPPHAPLFRRCVLLRPGLTPDSRCGAIGGSSDFAHCSLSRQSHKAESSSFRGFTRNPSFLRTIHSLPVALHPVSPRRSYFPLLAFSSAREGLPPSNARSIPSARARSSRPHFLASRQKKPFRGHCEAGQNETIPICQDHFTFTGNPSTRGFMNTDKQNVDML